MDYDPRNIEMGRRALTFGWLSNDQAKWCLDEATRQRRGLIDIARQANLLTEQQCQQLMQQFTGSADLSQDGQQTVLGSDVAKTIHPAALHPQSSSEAQTIHSPRQPISSGLDSRPSTTSGSQSRPSVGEIFDNYEITRLLGEGGMGAVFAAKQGEVEYALKVITCADFSALARFEREATAVAAVDSHPNIVKIHKYSEFNGVPYLVFDMIDGKSLDHYIQPGQPYGVSESVSIVQTIADALRFSHEKGVLHRDIKPANVLIRSDGTPFLTDFGLARAKDSESLTQSSDFLGTPHYMAPEQAASENDKVGPGSDIWALGAILYELVTGYKPFPGETLMVIVNSILFRDPIEPRKHNDKLSEDLGTIILQCLNKDIDKRYQTAGDLAEDCRRLLAGEPIHGKRLSAYERTLGRLRRRFGRYFVYAIYVMIIGVAMVGLWVGYFYFVIKPRNQAGMELRNHYSNFVKALPQSRAESATLAARETFQQLGLSYLMGVTTSQSLNNEAVVLNREEFVRVKNKFVASYGADHLPDEFVASNGADQLPKLTAKKVIRPKLIQSKFIEKLGRLRKGKRTSASGKTDRGLDLEGRVERQFLIAFDLMKSSLWLESFEAFGELKRLTKTSSSDSSEVTIQSTFLRRFHELSKVVQCIFVLRGYIDVGSRTEIRPIQFLRTLTSGETQTDFMAGIYPFLRLRLVELETIEVIFTKGLEKNVYDSKSEAIALSLSRAYLDYESQLREAIGEDNIKEQAAWDLVVTREKKANFEAFRQKVVAKALSLSKLASSQDRELYYQLLDLFYRTQEKELKERYVYFNFADFKLFYSGYKKAFSVYQQLKDNPKREAEAYDYWADSLNYAQKCQTLDKSFKLPEEFSRDGIVLVIQRGYLLALQQAKMRKLDLSRKSGLEEMSRVDWALFYQLILTGSRAGVYSQFMGREVMEPLHEKGIFKEEIRKAPNDPYCRFWRGMVGPIVSNAQTKTDDPRKTHETYQRMLSECIADLDFALKDVALHDAFRAVALTERLYLQLKKHGYQGAQEKLGGIERVQKDMEWAVTYHPSPEVPLYLLVKFRRDWPVTKQLKELERVQTLIDERWTRSGKSTDGRSSSYWLGKDRPPNNPLLPMGTPEHESLNHRLLRGRVNRLNVHGDYQEALQLIERGLKRRVRADLLCEKVHAHLGLGQTKLAWSVYEKLLKIHGDRKPIEYWGEDRLKSLVRAMNELKKKNGD